jgi:pancreatic triacylglycerol lipase
MNDVFFMLFTKANPIEGQRIGFNLTEIRASNWNSSHDVRLLVHGWVASYRVLENVRTTAEFLKKGDYNVLAVDWSAGAYSNYTTSRWRVGDVGRVIAQFVDFLSMNGLTQSSKINIVGHSLGSHIAGHAGKAVKNGRINAIFGTDPSGTEFDINDPANRLDKDDAVYTEAIVTSLRFREPIAQVTFYANWGLQQPGCDEDDLCNHHRATEYYSESVNTDQFVAIQCSSLSAINDRNCSGTGVVTYLGGDKPKTVSGVFYLETNSRSPYAMGAGCRHQSISLMFLFTVFKLISQLMN